MDYYEIDFTATFEALTGHPPFPWQVELFEKWFSTGRMPDTCSLPTGLGKTSVMAIWLIGLACCGGQLPRRLVYVVNRRTVVDQATREAEKLRANLAKVPALASRLQQLCAIACDPPLAISTLRGQFADNGEWCADPSRPAIVVGTVDMIGSRLLFSGYGLGFRSRPLHAGFLGQDSLLIHDEAHLEPAFQRLIETIRAEQTCGRTPDMRPMSVMALSATVRSAGSGDPSEAGPKSAFVLTNVDRQHPVVRRRIDAPKRLTLHEVSDEKQVVAKITELSLSLQNSGQAILIFLRTIEAAQAVQNAMVGKGGLDQNQVATLTGTKRGLERDRMAADNPVFARFLPEKERRVDVAEGTAYLVCTAAGEVGVDMSADHLVCDLTPFDSMAQRFGRVNRYGDSDSTIHVVHETPSVKKKEDALDHRRWLTLALLEELHGDASPSALGRLDARARLEAFTPSPQMLDATDILFDAWTLTTIRGNLPGRPPVELYLHGVSEWQPPETHVGWREEVALITGDLLRRYSPDDLLEDYPLKPHELLRDRSDRVFTHLDRLASRSPDSPVWLLDDAGTVEVLTLQELSDKENKDRISSRTLLLPPRVGGLRHGTLDGTSSAAIRDVADEWYDASSTMRRRLRVLSADRMHAPPEGMRLVRPPLDLRPGAEDREEEGAVSAGTERYWHWYVRVASAEDAGSRTAKAPVTWQVHTDDVTCHAGRIVAALSMSDDMRQAVLVAARGHDLGKRRVLFQRSLGNPDPTRLLAKSGGRMKPLDITSYRHEFGSLSDVAQEVEFHQLSDDMKSLVCHLIAAHHGRGRPHFPPGEDFDPQPNGRDMEMLAVEVVSRFARLQRRYGRWGLAYLESLLRAADWAASAKPSAFVENTMIAAEKSK